MAGLEINNSLRKVPQLQYPESDLCPEATTVHTDKKKSQRSSVRWVLYFRIFNIETDTEHSGYLGDGNNANQGVWKHFGLFKHTHRKRFIKRWCLSKNIKNQNYNCKIGVGGDYY